MVAFILDHSETKVLLVDREFHRVVTEALAHRQGPAAGRRHRRPASATTAPRSATRPTRSSSPPAMPTTPGTIRPTNGTPISLNYTSGTTGNPKGVVYSHRGAALSAYGNATQWALGIHPVYLWTLPMFHCNGWCFPWTLALVAGTLGLPAPRQRRDDLRRAGRPRRHAHVRRAHHHAVHHRRHGRRAPAAVAQGRVHDRRRAAARRRAGGAGEGEFPRHPRLRPDRGLRPGDDLLVARGLGRAAARTSARSSRRARACAMPPRTASR
mgnify:CR=1 FL=1